MLLVLLVFVLFCFCTREKISGAIFSFFKPKQTQFLKSHKDMEKIKTQFKKRKSRKDFKKQKWTQSYFV